RHQDGEEAAGGDDLARGELDGEVFPGDQQRFGEPGRRAALHGRDYRRQWWTGGHLCGARSLRLNEGRAWRIARKRSSAPSGATNEEEQPHWTPRTLRRPTMAQRPPRPPARHPFRRARRPPRGRPRTPRSSTSSSGGASATSTSTPTATS